VAGAKDSDEDLKTAIAQARKKPLAFGLCLGKKPDGTVLLTHKTKAAPILGQQARKAGETGKFTFGTMSVKSKNLLLTCEGDPPAGAARKIKDFLKGAGLPMKVKLLDAAGATLEDDGEDDEEEADAKGSAVDAEPDAKEGAGGNESDPATDTAAPEETPQDDALAAKWAETHARLQAAIDSSSNDSSVPLTEAREKLQNLVEQAEQGAFDAALAGVKGVTEAIRSEAAAASAVAKADNDKQRWETNAPKMQRLVESTVAAGAGNIKKIQAVWNLAESKAGAEDYATAAKSLTMLTQLIQDARDAAAKANEANPAAEPAGASQAAPTAETAGGNTAAQAGAGIEPGAPGLVSDVVEGVTEAVGDAVDSVADAVGDALQDAAETVSEVLETVGEVVDDIVETVADTLGLGGGDDVPVFITQPEPTDPADLSGTVADKIARAEARLAQIDGLTDTYVAIIAGTTAPPEWGTEKARIAGIIDDARAAGDTADEGNVDASLADLVTLETTLRAAIAKRTDWKAALELFEVKFDPLEHHAQAGAAPQIKPKIDQIKVDRDAAIADADALKFEDAIKALRTLGARCDETRVLADDFAHYSAVFGQREGKVLPIIAAAASGVAEIDTLKAEITTLFNDAKADATAENYGDGVSKLDRIPPLVDRRAGLVLHEAEYTTLMGQAQTVITDIATYPANVRAVLAAPIAKLSADFEAAKVANTNSYSVSRNQMREVRDRGRVLDTDCRTNEGYLIKLPPFNTQLTTFEEHAGRVGIEDMILAMQNDKTSAASEAAGGKFSTAETLLDRSQPDWATTTTRATECEAYIVKRDAVRAKIDALRPRPEVAPGLGASVDLMSAAAVEAINKRFVTALATVNEAEARADAAEAAGDAQNALGALKDTAALDGLDADYEAAHTVYTNMRANVATADSAGTFSALLTSADTEAQKARDAAHATPPDPVAARGFLDAAISILEDTLPKVLASAAFATNLAAAKAMATTTLPPLNDEDCIKDPIADITRLATEAEDLAKSPGFDFPAADLKLVEAMATARKAQADAALYPDIKRDRDAIIALKATITPVAVATLMVTTIARLDALLQDITDALAAKDFPRAKTEATTGAAMQAAVANDITTCTTYPVQKNTLVESRYAAATSDGAKPHVDRAKALVTRADAAMVAGSYESGFVGLFEASWAMDAAVLAESDSATYTANHDATKVKLDALLALDSPPMAARISEIKAAFDTAVSQADNQFFVVANRHMMAVDEHFTPELTAQAVAAKGYEDARAAAQTARDAIDPAMAEAVRPTIDRLAAKYTSAEGMAASDDFVTAKTLMEEVKTAAEAAKVAAENSAQLTATMDAVDALGPDDAPSDEDIADVVAVLTNLKGRTNAAIVTAELAEAEAQIAIAQDGAKPAADRVSALKEAAEAARAIEQTLVQHNELLTSIETARARIATLEAHVQAAYVAADVAEMNQSIEAIVLLISAGDQFSKATSDLNAVMTRYAEVQEDADGQVTFLALRASTDLDTKLDDLEQHDHAYAVRASIDAIRAKITLADDKATERDHAAACAALDEAAILAHSARMMADMRGNTAPSADDVKKIINGPGGFDELDAMMDGLEPDAERAVMRAAFEARFGCTLENWQGGAAVADGNQQGPDIRRFYQVMSDLPNSATLDNDAFRVFRNEQTAGGGSRYDGANTIIMDEGQPELSSAYLFGREDSLGTVDADCQPANEDPVPFFSWNTLHEVGHAVDDTHNFMDGKVDNASFGGWRHHNTNPQDVAVAVADEFDYDSAYVAQRIGRNANPAVPDAPDGVTMEEWESRRIRVEGWLAQATVGNKPWDSMSKAQRLAINGRVYHESYNFRWYSYLLSARSKGITGYQFRAPAEWFSELYAAYHSGKLKDTHPSAGWLSGL